MRATHQYDQNALKGQSGISLIEVMVAAAVLGLTVSAIAAMLTNSDIFRSANDHNRQARVISQEELEDPIHHYRNYDNAPSSGGSIALDVAEAWPSTPANRTWTVSPENTVLPIGVTPAVSIPYKTISSVITWNENGQAKSLTLVKRITKVP